MWNYGTGQEREREKKQERTWACREIRHRIRMFFREQTRASFRTNQDRRRHSSRYASFLYAASVSTSACNIGNDADAVGGDFFCSQLLDTAIRKADDSDSLDPEAQLSQLTGTGMQLKSSHNHPEFHELEGNTCDIPAALQQSLDHTHALPATKWARHSASAGQLQADERRGEEACATASEERFRATVASTWSVSAWRSSADFVPSPPRGSSAQHASSSQGPSTSRVSSS